MSAPTKLTLTWIPNPSATSQIVKYRQRGNIAWITNSGIAPSNPLLASGTTAVIAAPSTNIVYQAQVDTVCTTGIASSGIQEMIVFAQQTLTSTVVTGVISVNQSPMTTVDTINYRLVSNNNVVLQNVSATGLSPAVSFTTVGSGNYTVQYRYGATINGQELYSDAASQNNAWYTSGTITV